MEEKLDMLITRLEWMGTCLEKLVDINMLALGELNPEQVDFLDYVHNKKQVFLSELDEPTFAKYKQESHDH